MTDIVSTGKKKFVRVMWWDAQDYTDAGWLTEDQAVEFNSEPCLVESRGWLLSKTKHYLTLAADRIAPITYGRAMKIPMKMVKEIKELDIGPPDVV